jgi:microcystin-dependent protein
MTTIYMGTIQAFAFPFAPKNWATCNGQLMAITQNQALFSLIGTTYGGDGITTFALPDLRGRTALGVSTSGPFGFGAIGGEEAHTLTIAEIPQHNHLMQTDAQTVATNNVNIPTGNALGQSTGSNGDINIYRTGATANGTLAPPSIANAGNSQSHENRMPVLVINFCICLFGVFPSRN